MYLLCCTCCTTWDMVLAVSQVIGKSWTRVPYTGSPVGLPYFPGRFLGPALNGSTWTGNDAVCFLLIILNNLNAFNS